MVVQDKNVQYGSASASRLSWIRRAKKASGQETKKRQGFTLIELLVVIAIIAVLAALVLPAMAKAKAQARRIQCLKEMQQWALAFQMYADDNNDWIPREGYAQSGDVVLNSWAEVQAVKDPWYNALPRQYLHRPAAYTYAHPTNVAVFYESRSFFHCPSASFPKDVRDVRYQFAVFSRAMNSQLINYPNIPTIRLGRIKDHARTVLFLDNLLDGEKKVVKEQENLYLGQPSSYANRFAGRRHRQGGNLVFADGHGSWFAGEKVVETHGNNIGWAIVPPNEVVWEPD
jgi:prepilin-type N-terminal cleavage/methylation domain-containing protein/prepilin-type processing-associated H-X9-DG protein